MSEDWSIQIFITLNRNKPENTETDRETHEWKVIEILNYRIPLINIHTMKFYVNITFRIIYSPSEFVNYSLEGSCSVVIKHNVL